MSCELKTEAPGTSAWSSSDAEDSEKEYYKFRIRNTRKKFGFQDGSASVMLNAEESNNSSYEKISLAPGPLNVAPKIRDGDTLQDSYLPENAKGRISGRLRRNVSAAQNELPELPINVDSTDVTPAETNAEGAYSRNPGRVKSSERKRRFSALARRIRNFKNKNFSDESASEDSETTLDNMSPFLSSYPTRFQLQTRSKLKFLAFSNDWYGDKSEVIDNGVAAGLAEESGMSDFIHDEEVRCDEDTESEVASTSQEEAEYLESPSSHSVATSEENDAEELFYHHRFYREDSPTHTIFLGSLSFHAAFMKYIEYLALCLISPSLSFPFPRESSRRVKGCKRLDEGSFHFGSHQPAISKIEKYVLSKRDMYDTNPFPRDFKQAVGNQVSCSIYDLGTTVIEDKCIVCNNPLHVPNCLVLEGRSCDSFDIWNGNYRLWHNAMQLPWIGSKFFPEFEDPLSSRRRGALKGRKMKAILSHSFDASPASPQSSSKKFFSYEQNGRKFSSKTVDYDVEAPEKCLSQSSSSKINGIRKSARLGGKSTQVTSSKEDFEKKDAPGNQISDTDVQENLKRIMIEKSSKKFTRLRRCSLEAEHSEGELPSTDSSLSERVDASDKKAEYPACQNKKKGLKMWRCRHRGISEEDSDDIIEETEFIENSHGQVLTHLEATDSGKQCSSKGSQAELVDNMLPSEAASYRNELDFSEVEISGSEDSDSGPIFSNKVQGARNRSSDDSNWHNIYNDLDETSQNLLQDSMVPSGKVEFIIGRHCGRQAMMWHTLQFFKYNLLRETYKGLKKLLKAKDTPKEPLLACQFVGERVGNMHFQSFESIVMNANVLKRQHPD